MSERQDDAHDEHVRREVVEPQLEHGPYSVFLIREDSTWEQPTFRVPEGMTESQVLRLLEASDRDLIFAERLQRDDDAPEESVRELPKLPRAKLHPPVEVMHCPVLSTAHLSHDEAQRKPNEWPTHCHESEHGFVVYFGTLADLRNTIESVGVHESLADELWPGFLAAAAWAEKHGFEWLRFDGDGPEQPGLPVFEW